MVTKEEDAVIESPQDNLKQRLNPESGVHVSPAEPEGNTPIVPEKPSEDGYNWRKYGQKNVKGNEYVRSYYKCSYPNCQVKKQVERLQDGRITDVTYLGKHDHAKPHPETQDAVPPLVSVQIHVADCPPSTDKSSSAHILTTDNVEPIETCEAPAVATPVLTTPVSLQPSTLARDDHNENLTPKKRKKGVDGADMTGEKPGREPRVIVQTVSEVDIVNDGFRWRKYGQKMVKGSPNPRSYYRCSTAGCPVKKHVERASHDLKIVVTTYEGQHDHSMPPVRTVVPQSAAPSSGGMESDDINKSKSEESDATLDGTITCKGEKDNAVFSTAKEESNVTIAIEAKPEIISSDQDTQHKIQKTNLVGQNKKETSDVSVQVGAMQEITPIEQKRQDTFGKASSSDNTDRTRKQENTAAVHNSKLKDVSSAAQQRSDPVRSSPHHEAKSNGQRRLDTEPVNC